MDKLQQLLKYMFEKKASDIILTAGVPPQIRLSGVLQSIPDQEKLMGPDVEKLLFTILTDMQKENFKRDKELDISFGVEGLSRFRLNAYYQRGSIAVAIRLIPFDIPTMEELGLPSIIKEFADKPNGLILVTGPTGSGKSTTLSSIIEYINERRRCHIITIEDPIEFIHSHKKSIIDQREINEDTLSFIGALKYVLRQDPDVILIGEMRDLETISACLTAAETGHLVIATLHTNDAAQTVDRIIDVFQPHQQGQIRTQLAAVLLCVIAQQLIPTVDGNGRILVAEIMVNTAAVANLIREAKTHQIPSVIETSTREGMQSRDKSIKEMYMKGIIAYDEALRRMKNPGELMRMME